MEMPFLNEHHRWTALQNLPNKSFSCGFCGDKVSSNLGYSIVNTTVRNSSSIGGIYICSNCSGPNFFTPRGARIPGDIFGRDIRNVPSELNNLYQEARKCAKENCYTASVLVCRKMLMNIAIQQGAQQGQQFIKYVDYLSDLNFIPPNGKKWVDHIRKKGNEATHEIAPIIESDAKDLIVFIEMLLIFIYEFPSMID